MQRKSNSKLLIEVKNTK